MTVPTLEDSAIYHMNNNVDICPDIWFQFLARKGDGRRREARFGVETGPAGWGKRARLEGPDEPLAPRCPRNDRHPHPFRAQKRAWSG
jgi:hypothetical protein